MAEKRTSGRTGRSSSQLLRSVHEGWAFHFTPQSRVWTKRWLVLDGSRLVVFSSERTSSQVVFVSLNLGQGTKIKDVTLQPHVHGLDIQLITMKGLKESRIDFFGFSTPNECDLWKAYILGFSYGIVPENLNLLPGQLKDVREAILDVGPAPPPLPMSDPKRPTLRNIPGFVEHKRPSLQQLNASSPLPTSSVHCPSAVTSPYSDINESNRSHSVNLSSAGEVFENVEETDIIEQLEQRRAELAMMALDKEVEREPLPLASYGDERRKIHSHGGSFAKMQHSPVWSQPQSTQLLAGRDSGHSQSSQSSSQKSQVPIILTNNNKLLPFYDDPQRNKVPPQWFINCSREKAEMILTAARHHGNMLMRPSYNVNPSETYVISIRRDLPGGLELRHYAVYRTSEGFKLDVIDKHRPMSCLFDVMDFFTHYVGPSARPINSHEVECFLSDITSPGFVSSSKFEVPPDTGVAMPNEVKSDKHVTTITVVNSEVVQGSSQMKTSLENNDCLKECENVPAPEITALPSGSSKQEMVSIAPKAEGLTATVKLDSMKGFDEGRRETNIHSASTC